MSLKALIIKWVILKIGAWMSKPNVIAPLCSLKVFYAQIIISIILELIPLGIQMFYAQIIISIILELISLDKKKNTDKNKYIFGCISILTCPKNYWLLGVNGWGVHF